MAWLQCINMYGPLDEHRPDVSHCTHHWRALHPAVVNKNTGGHRLIPSLTASCSVGTLNTSDPKVKDSSTTSSLLHLLILPFSFSLFFAFTSDCAFHSTVRLMRTRTTAESDISYYACKKRVVRYRKWY